MRYSNFKINRLKDRGLKENPNKFIPSSILKSSPSQTVDAVMNQIKFKGEYLITSSGGSILGWRFQYLGQEILCRQISLYDRRIIIYFNAVKVNGLFGDILKVYLEPILLEKLTYSKEFVINEEDLFKYTENNNLPNRIGEYYY